MVEIIDIKQAKKPEPQHCATCAWYSKRRSSNQQCRAMGGMHASVARMFDLYCGPKAALWLSQDQYPTIPYLFGRFVRQWLKRKLS